jgi:hypothetical protein
VSDPSDAATVTTPTASGQTLTFAPTDDAYVDQASSGTNFGGTTSLVTDNSPVQHLLLRFDLATGDCTITGATLSLTVGTSTSDGSSRGGDVRSTATASWSESSVTWTNAPAPVGSVIASLGSVSAGASYALDVTSAITGDGPLSLRMSSTSSNGARYFSKEGGTTTQRPSLTVLCA